MSGKHKDSLIAILGWSTQFTCSLMPTTKNMFQEVDVAIGSITISTSRMTAVDFSVSNYETASGYLAHIPRDLSKWAVLLRPYNYR